jgi:oligosaccharide repeat unit polymerase
VKGIMKKITNPNFIYIVTFVVPFLVYTLQWSTIYPPLTPQFLGFYLVTFIIAFFIGVLVDKLPPFKFQPIPVFRYNGFVILILFLLYALDCWYAGFVPLFAFYTGDASYAGGLEFGIPTIHVLLITFTLFFAVYLVHQLISNRKWSLFWYYLLLFIPLILLQQRSSLMYIVIASAFLFIISRKRISLKVLIRLFFFAMVVLYLFGFLGNLRSANGDSTFIPRNSGVKEEFLESWVPNEFYWSYLYIASPVANLQNNINIEKNVIPNYPEFFIFEMTPDFISKKIVQNYGLKRREFNQINPFLNVGTIYARAFSYLSWTGLFVMFFYLMGLMNLYYIIIRKSYLYGASGVAMMFSMIALGNFDNSITWSAYSFPLFYPFLFSVIRGLRIGSSGQPGREKSVQLFKSNALG